MPAKQPNRVPPASTAECMAVKALFAGNANENQQKILKDWLIKVACGIGDDVFYGSDRDSNFAQGRRYVGLLLLREAERQLKQTKVT